MGNAGGEALGWINFQQALSMSDNVYFYEMGNRLGINNLVDFALQIGMGRKTGIELEGEAQGCFRHLKINARYLQGRTGLWVIPLTLLSGRG